MRPPRPSSICSIWFFSACTSLNYLDEIRSDLLPKDMDRSNLDVFGTTKSVPTVAGMGSALTLIDGILQAQTMEQMVASLQQNLERALAEQPKMTPSRLKSELREYRSSYFREGAGDNPAKKSQD